MTVGRYPLSTVKWIFSTSQLTSKVLCRLIEKIFSVIAFHVNGIYKMVYINTLYNYSLLENKSV